MYGGWPRHHGDFFDDKFETEYKTRDTFDLINEET